MTSPPLFRSATLKLIGIGFLALLMAIPLASVEGLRRERSERRDTAEQELARAFGGPQRLAAPLLRVPVSYRRLDGEHETIELRDHFVLPDQVTVESKLGTEVRRRGIFEFPVYRAEVALAARFADPALFTAEQPNARLDLAEWVIPIDDPRGLREVRVEHAPKSRIEPAGTGPGEMALFRLARLAELPQGPGRIDLVVAGSSRLQFLPMARDFRANLSAGWGDPSFIGAYLPTQSTIEPERFVADWQVLEFNRNLPAQFLGSELDAYELGQLAFGVNLFQPGDVYQRHERTTKYGLLVIALSFGVFFLFETLKRMRLHPVQYLLVGAAQASFFLVLLAAAEHLPFGMAYLLAALVLVAMVAGYAGSVLGGGRHAATIAGWLSVLLATLYVLVGAEDYALLAGSGLVLALIGATMYLTRRIDWYRVGEVEPPALPTSRET